MTFAARLKKLREAAGMSRYGLGKLAGLKQQSMFNLEDGKSKPKWETVVALADALGVSTEAFRNGDEPAEERKPAKKRGK